MMKNKITLIVVKKPKTAVVVDAVPAIVCT
jgi:hypothetical protein